MLRRAAIWGFAALFMTACVAEPVERSPLNTYPPADTTVPTGLSTTVPVTVASGAREIITFAKDRQLGGSYRYDVYGPDRGDLLPIIVLIHDLDGPDSMRALTEALAETHIVITPKYDGPVRGGRFPDPLAATACALVLAADGTAYGGDPGDVTIIGTGFGALAAFLVVNSAALYLPTDCATGDQVRPVQLVGIGGTWSPEVLAERSFDAMSTFMGGTPTQVPASWALLDPLQFTEPGEAKLTLLRGDNDPDADVTDSFANALGAAGWPVVVGKIEAQSSRSALTNSIPTIVAYLTDD